MSLGLGMGLWIGHNPAATGGGGGGDVTAPTLSSPVGTQTGSTTATIGATTNEGNGTMYGVVTTSSTAPTATQVKAGQNDGGTSAVFAGSTAVSSTGAKTISATGLTASTAYYAHIMHEDAAGNKSTVSSSAQFTTAAAATQWNAATSNANYTISGTNSEIATYGTSGDGIVRASSSHSGSGDWSFTLVMGGAGNHFVGLANATQSTANGVFLGGSGSNSVGWSSASGNIVINNATATNGGIALTWINGNTLTLRLKNGKLYVAKNGTYATGMDPVAETGGVDVSAMGALFPSASANTAGRSFTADFTNWA